MANRTNEQTFLPAYPNPDPQAHMQYAMTQNVRKPPNGPPRPLADLQSTQTPPRNIHRTGPGTHPRPREHTTGYQSSTIPAHSLSSLLIRTPSHHATPTYARETEHPP
ncbi:hypothetical protein EJ06DRAFT_269229 [Trichodelitschia bisporula]|uniref:Uncharacterized protein n=1 Tax=Trichodelitschia bisporula TaxID=703511 RepID=A0A6G1HHR5_9PEZI|nr:hypothetical protein EJ06DRAFT_269229 [Trichodelitschia bisporula]